MSRHVTTMTLDDAEHYTPAKRAEIIASYPAHEREARAKGIPTFGLGPGNEIYAHAANEACPVEHLSGAVAFYAALVAKLNGKV